MALRNDLPKRMTARQRVETPTIHLFFFARLTLSFYSHPLHVYDLVYIDPTSLESGENVDLGVERKLRTDFSNAHLTHSMSNLDTLINRLSLRESSDESTGEGISSSVRVDDSGSVEGGDGVDFVDGGSGDDGRGRSLGDDDDSGSGGELGGSGELEGNFGNVLGLASHTISLSGLLAENDRDARCSRGWQRKLRPRTRFR